MLDQSIKNEIINEVRPLMPGVDVATCVELFWEILHYPCEQKELQGIKTRFPKAIKTIFGSNSNHSDIINSSSTFFKVEPLFKLILFIVNRNTFNDINRNKEGLASVLRAMDLIEKDINLSKPPIYYRNTGNNLEQIVKTYELRNTESHNCEKWGRRELYNNIASVLVAIFYCINKNKKLLLQKIKEIQIGEVDVSSYMDELIFYFKNKMKKFIMLNGEENLRVMDRYVMENIECNEEDSEEEVEKVVAQARRGTIDELRSALVPEKRMIIWGEAGTGKSTVLEYLAYIDAQKRKRVNSERIPVLVPLGLLISKEDTLKNYIAKKLNVDERVLNNILRNGQVNLFLDGINEIPNDHFTKLRSIRLREIKLFLDEYKKCFVIITNRPNEVKDFNDIPIFNLLKLTNEQMDVFLQKNAEKPDTIKIITDSINENKRLNAIVRTPLMFSRLIDIVDATGKIPNSEGAIIGAFLDTILKRERFEKLEYEFDVKRARYLLRAIAYNGLEDSSTNAGISEEKILSYMQKCMETYMFKVDTFYMLEMFVQLGILLKREELYLFTHQAYQDYYYALEVKAILES